MTIAIATTMVPTMNSSNYNTAPAAQCLLKLTLLPNYVIQILIQLKFIQNSHQSVGKRPLWVLSTWVVNVLPQRLHFTLRKCTQAYFICVTREFRIKILKTDCSLIFRNIVVNDYSFSARKCPNFTKHTELCIRILHSTKLQITKFRITKFDFPRYTGFPSDCLDQSCF